MMAELTGDSSSVSRGCLLVAVREQKGRWFGVRLIPRITEQDEDEGRGPAE